jgi:hypothetical protein
VLRLSSKATAASSESPIQQQGQRERREARTCCLLPPHPRWRHCLLSPRLFLPWKAHFFMAGVFLETIRTLRPNQMIITHYRSGLQVFLSLLKDRYFYCTLCWQNPSLLSTRQPGFIFRFLCDFNSGRGDGE